MNQPMIVSGPFVREAQLLSLSADGATALIAWGDERTHSETGRMVAPSSSLTPILTPAQARRNVTQIRRLRIS